MGMYTPAQHFLFLKWGFFHFGAMIVVISSRLQDEHLRQCIVQNNFFSLWSELFVQRQFSVCIQTVFCSPQGSGGVCPRESTQRGLTWDSLRLLLSKAYSAFACLLEQGVNANIRLMI